jgi:hypothetical protein
MLRTFGDDRTNFLFVSGVASVVGCGMLRTRSGVPDGDWYEANQPHLITSENKKVFMESINRDSLMTATTVICATKVNYWLMNHHVGQSLDRNTAVRYVQKVLTLKFGIPLPP